MTTHRMQDEKGNTRTDDVGYRPRYYGILIGMGIVYVLVMLDVIDECFFTNFIWGLW